MAADDRPGVAGRWRQIGAWTLLAASVVAVAAVVGSSLYSEHYFFRSDEARRSFVPDPWDVATAFVLSSGESAVLCLIVCIGPGRTMWRRLLLAFVVFVPWSFAVWEPIGTHVPGFLMINALWVSVIVLFLATALFAVSAIHIWHRMMPHAGGMSVV